jgi:hypothetical protein
MNNDLYFIAILARAFDQPDPAEALSKAFAEIERLGRLPRYQTGFRQFCRFMAKAHHRQVPDLRLEKDGVSIAQYVFGQAAEEMRIPLIRPGSYSVRLATGRLLWMGDLHAQDLLWADAFPATALPLAADSDDALTVYTRELHLLDNEIVLRVYPGLEYGTIGIRIDRWKQA